VIILALDSTTPSGSIGLGLPDGSIDTREGDASRSWGERLPGDLMSLLRAHGVRLVDVDLFAVASGPGSLTGLRVGIATIQGCAMAADRPVAAISALDVLAEHGRNVLGAGEAVPPGRARAGSSGSVRSVTATFDVKSGADSPAGRAESSDERPSLRGPFDDVVLGAWTNAMRGEVFTGLYRPRLAADPREDPWESIGEPEVGLPELAARAWQARLGEERLQVFGNTEGELGGSLRAVFGSRVTLHSKPLLAPGLVTIASRRAARGAVGPPHAVRPLYVRKPDAVLARERARLAERDTVPPSAS
jgi:tRNA threonylcarbamoyl adenosine modification protein YeaZ